MAGRHRVGCLAGLARFAVLAVLGTSITACKPDESHPQPTVTVTVETGIRRGDQCRTNGAAGRTNTGQLLICARHRGLDYDTWDVG